MRNYHKIDSTILQFDLESVEFKFGMWITKKEFGQRLNISKPLPKGQFYMSVRVVAKDIEITEMIARRLIKQFISLNIIRLVSSSKNPKQGSIYEYLVQLENNTVENIVITQYEHSKSERISDFEEAKEHSSNTYDNTVDNTSKKKRKIKEKIYIDLKFIDDVIDKVKLTKEQYDKLLTKYHKELLHKEIIALDNYIANGKGNRYKDHYRVLNVWCNKNNKEVAKESKKISLDDY